MTKYKIILVDDQSFVRHIYGSDLKRVGFEVACFESGKLVLEHLSCDFADLILLDAMMPEMDGFETCMAIRKLSHCRKTPIVFLTANANKQTVVQAVQSGANDFCVKGPETEPLIKKINKFLESPSK